MLNYLSKFVLQMLPTISATVIGAYIVATWINPKTPPDPAKVAAGTQGQQAAKAAPAPAEPAREATAEAVEAKLAETAPRTAQTANAPDKIRVIPIVKQPEQAPEAAATSPAAAPEATAAVEERKGANELARAAIQRLRGSADTARATDEPVKPIVSPVRTQQVRAAPEAVAQPSTAAAVAPPLPPAVSITSPRFAPTDSPDQAAYPERMSPPAEIPTAHNPLNLQASHRVAESPSIADDFLSATKSFFRVITPQ
jgi:hypothetical protein